MTRRGALKAALISAAGLASTAAKAACDKGDDRGSKVDKRTLPMYGTLHWKRLYPGRPMIIGSNAPAGYLPVGITPDGEIVWIGQ